MALVVESVATGQSPITKPTGLAVGDLMVGVVSQVYNAAFPAASTPSGWTSEIGGFDNRAYGFFWKIADSGDVAASNFTFQDAGGGHMYGTLYRISGSAADALVSFEIFNGADSDAGTTGTVATSITPAHAGSLFIAGYLVGDDASSGANSTYTLGGSPTFTERYDSALDARTTFSVADAPIADLTACGNATVVTTATTPAVIRIFGALIYAKVDATATPSLLQATPQIYQTIPQMIVATPTIYSVSATVPTPTSTNTPKTAGANIINTPKS